MSGETTAERQHRSDAKRSAALSSVLAAAAITLLKFLTGLLTGSLGMLSEAAHSAIDLIAAAITLFTVRISDRPADEQHNYGHGKLESLSAAVEILLMLGSCIWIAFEAVRRIMYHRHLDLKWSIWPFIVLLLSIAVDFARSRNLKRVAEAQRSDALAADAVHFGTDIWSSTAVLIGLLAAFAGERLHIRLLEYADPVAALAVAAVIVSVTWKLAHNTVDSLLDATPPEVRAKIRSDLVRDLENTADILSVDRVRVRRSGSNYFVDLTLGIPRTVTFQRSEQITSDATAAVQARLPNADVVIHTVPMASLRETIFDRIRAAAARSNLAIHDVSVQQYDGALHVEQHLEVDERMPLREAHNIVTALEAEMRRDIPEVSSVLTHIESEPATIAHTAEADRDTGALQAALRQAARKFPEIVDIHDILTTRSDHDYGIHIRCHCTLPDDLPMERVHAIISELESDFRASHPTVSRVLIHPEPATDNRR
ncbi:MAG: cation-efflux pump [Acidobacteriota bacterium]|nr:cation-efflux pump [Acidobacteriota bacterium]